MHVRAIVAAVLRPTVSCIAQLSSVSQQREIVMANNRNGNKLSTGYNPLLNVIYSTVLYLIYNTYIHKSRQIL